MTLLQWHWCKPERQRALTVGDSLIVDAKGPSLMFCPKCATQNVDGASYCRACGANISLVPQALTGQLPTAERSPDEYYGRRRRRQPSTEYAVRSLVAGVAFAVMALMAFRFSPGSARWWFWLLLPAMMMFGRGFSEFIRVNQRRSGGPKPDGPTLNSVRPPELRAPQTGELMPPVSSVTEGTTRHLGADARTRPFVYSEPPKPS